MFRVGLGHDTHRTIEGRPLILGGVTIPSDSGLDGHSDADVLLHAITDAILGAAGLGDIGEWFPDTSAEFAGADSGELLSRVMAEVAGQGWAVVNLDCTIFAERPKLSQHKQAIELKIAALLKVDPAAINVKAKTGERVGPVGRGEAMEAQAVVLLSKET
ncbi:MAG: 2-C-methyl-D-erythritol 2,4-cyclodiphosphate synthase [Planctomycetaceae bacterium]|nr:2-C-methyl-D-erythritol 2,4-cyclodiphosphate synthase [Planctomycetaceae bacterium]